MKLKVVAESGMIEGYILIILGVYIADIEPFFIFLYFGLDL